VKKNLLLKMVQKIKVRVQIPKEDNPMYNLTGHLMNFTMDAKDEISTLKDRLSKIILLPPNRQKLKLQPGNIHIKDGTLAFYNINNNCLLELSLKSRGGKAKKAAK